MKSRYDEAPYDHLTDILQPVSHLSLECARRPMLVNIMKFSNSIISCLPLLLAAIVFAPVQDAIASPGTATLELDYGAGTPCTFNTTSGVSITGSQANIISASGTFGTGCQLGGGSTGPVGINLTALPASVQVNNPVAVSWSATADICRFDPQTALPAPLANWPAQGNACIGALECAQQHTINNSLTVGGTYTFGLTCTSGETQSHAEQTLSKSASVTVTGGTPPPSTTCVAPAGITRQTSGALSDSGVMRQINNADLQTWSHVFGINWAPVSPVKYYAWPGLFGTTTKVYVNKNQYLSLEFTVPSNYPITTLPNYSPKGGFNSNASNVSTGVKWAVSITPDCGDFMQPAYGQPDYRCYGTYTTEQGPAFVWVVTQPGAPLSGFCNLNPGHTYFLNIIAAPLNNPTQSNCDSSVCHQNFQQTGIFSSGALLP